MYQEEPKKREHALRIQAVYTETTQSTPQTKKFYINKQSNANYNKDYLGNST